MPEINTILTGQVQVPGNIAAAAATPKVRVVTANLTLTAADSGTIFVANAADLVFTLPLTVSGIVYTFVCAALSTGTGLSVSPNSADNINEGTANKDIINTGATDVLGDAITLNGTGVTASAWFTTGKVGIWAAES